MKALQITSALLYKDHPSEQYTAGRFRLNVVDIGELPFWFGRRISEILPSSPENYCNPDSVVR